jgi:predicted transcriptional regulator
MTRSTEAAVRRFTRNVRTIGVVQVSDIMSEEEEVTLVAVLAMAVVPKAPVMQEDFKKKMIVCIYEHPVRQASTGFIERYSGPRQVTWLFSLGTHGRFD